MNCNFVEYFENTLKEFSNKVAIDDNQGKLTFNELNVYSDKVAVSVLNFFDNQRKPVPVYISKSRWAVVSFLGINKSGNFYVPLDVKSPFERTLKILEALDSEIIITDLEHKNKLIEIGFQGRLIILEDVFKEEMSVIEENGLLDKAKQIRQELSDIARRWFFKKLES